MTQAQDEARRRNAKLSTGPKTEEGKLTSRMNALKHGLRSQTLDQDIVLFSDTSGDQQQANPDPTGVESGEVDQILSRLKLHYSPQTPVEEMLVQRIALLNWRLGRIEMAERKAMEAYPGMEFALPPAGALERILKYERTMDRELHRTIKLLEKMVSTRSKGDNAKAQ